MTRIGGSPASWRPVARRLSESALVLGMTVVVAFALTHLLPGDPISVLTEGQGDGDDAAPPVWLQFADYLGDLLRGDFGRSWRYGGAPAGALIREAVPVTAVLATASLIVAVLVGIPAGLLSARWKGSWLDFGVTAASVLGLSLPPVVMATWLMLIAVAVGGAPAIGGGAGPGGLVLPVAAMALVPAAVLARATRAHILEVLNEDYVRCARAKGAGEWVVLVRHALPNVLSALATVAGALAGALFTSTTVVEIVFNLQGLGRLGVFGVLARDYPLVSAVVLVLVAAQVAISLAVDALIAVLDPRGRDPLDTP